MYPATKFYVAGLTEALSLKWRGDDIRVLDIWPLWAKTSLADVEARFTRHLGVRLTPEQVADTLCRAINPKTRWARGRVSWGLHLG